MNPVHDFPPCFHKIHSNNIFSPTPRSSEWWFFLQKIKNPTEREIHSHYGQAEEEFI
jgi:hypothetical protein